MRLFYTRILMRDSGERERYLCRRVIFSCVFVSVVFVARAQSRAFVVWKELEKSPTTGLGFRVSRYMFDSLYIDHIKAI